MQTWHSNSVACTVLQWNVFHSFECPFFLSLVLMYLCHVWLCFWWRARDVPLSLSFLCLFSRDRWNLSWCQLRSMVPGCTWMLRMLARHSSVQNSDTGLKGWRWVCKIVTLSSVPCPFIIISMGIVPELLIVLALVTLLHEVGRRYNFLHFFSQHVVNETVLYVCCLVSCLFVSFLVPFPWWCVETWDKRRQLLCSSESFHVPVNLLFDMFGCGTVSSACKSNRLTACFCFVPAAVAAL